MNCFLFKTDVLPDVQKFSLVLNLAKSSLDTGNTSEDKFHCMAVAYHVKKTYAGDTQYMTTGKNRYNPVDLWINYLGYIELQKAQSVTRP
jgi:hypothetical protein